MPRHDHPLMPVLATIVAIGLLSWMDAFMKSASLAVGAYTALAAARADRLHPRRARLAPARRALAQPGGAAHPPDPRAGGGGDGAAVLLRPHAVAAGAGDRDQLRLAADRAVPCRRPAGRAARPACHRRRGAGAGGRGGDPGGQALARTRGCGCPDRSGRGARLGGALRLEPRAPAPAGASRQPARGGHLPAGHFVHRAGRLRAVAAALARRRLRSATSRSARCSRYPARCC